MSKAPKSRLTTVSIPNVGWSWNAPSSLKSYWHDELVVSQGHRRLRNGSWSGGGPFYVYKESVTHGTPSTIQCKEWGWPNRRGTNVACGVDGFPYGPPPSFDRPSWSDQEFSANSHYATGYARARPGNPVASLGQFLVELRDLPQIPLLGAWKALRGVPLQDVPRVLFTRLGEYVNLGSEYLNHQFGWVPFVNDLKKMYNLWQTIDRRMAQIVRENGKNIRRKATIERSKDVSQYGPVQAGPYVSVRFAPPINCSNDSNARSIDTTIVRTEHNIWFSGGFRYYIPDVGSSQWTTRAKAALWGALPTPSLLWEVLPWSWLGDWFTNIGDVMSNMSVNAVDNLVTRYSYVMEHKRTETTRSIRVTHTPRWVWDGSVWEYVHPSVDHTFSSTKIVETKVRAGGGNPFGPGVNFDSLSAYQVNILAALGISRSSVR